MGHRVLERLRRLVKQMARRDRWQETPDARTTPCVAAGLTPQEIEYLQSLDRDPDLSLEDKVRYWRRERFILADLVQERLPAGTRLTVLDAGARDASLDPRWRGFRKDRIEFIGFEADATEAARLNQEALSQGRHCRYFGVGLWSSAGERSFYETAASGGSSLFHPNHPVTDRWKFESETNIMLGRDLLTVTKTSAIPVEALDDVLAKEPARQIDFMKLNVQGAELEILSGGTHTLRDVLGVQTEVSFVESYVGRPMFSDIDAVLRRAGFEFFDIIASHYMGRDRSPVTARQYPGLFGLYGHMVEAHVLYLRDPIRLAQTDSAWLSHFDLDRALKLVAIAEIYHQVEYAIELLFWLEEFFGGKGDGAAAAQIAGIRGLGLKKYDAYMRWHSEAFDRMILGAIP